MKPKATPFELRPSGMIARKDKTGTRFIAYLVPHGPDSQLDAEDMACGELLVSASNAHEQLVAALKDVLADVEDRGITQATINKAQAALAATGDSQAQSGPSASKGVQP